jgi:very-short-patch-repair endonuclease
VIEVDGGIHRGQAAYDAERDAVIAAHSLRILRIPNDDVRNRLDHVMCQIAAACHLDPANTSLPLSPRGEGAGG